VRWGKPPEDLDPFFYVIESPRLIVFKKKRQESTGRQQETECRVTSFGVSQMAIGGRAYINRTYVYICTYISYIYIYRERERERVSE
jgi:hypothetical protein